MSVRAYKPHILCERVLRVRFKIIIMLIIIKVIIYDEYGRRTAIKFKLAISSAVHRRVAPCNHLWTVHHPSVCAVGLLRACVCGGVCRCSCCHNYRATLHWSAHCYRKPICRSNAAKALQSSVHRDRI